MQYYGLALNLKDDPEVIATYREHHRHPWRGPLQGLRAVGVIDMRIFLLGRRLFMYVAAEDGFDPERDFARYVEENPDAARWNELMAGMQEKVEEAGQEEWWASMEMIFDLQEHLPQTSTEAE